MLLDRCQDCYVLYLPAIIIMFLLRDLTKDMFAFDNISSHLVLWRSDATKLNLNANLK